MLTPESKAIEASTIIEHVEHEHVSPPSDTVRLDDEVFVKMAKGLSSFGELTHDAHEGTQFEQKMTVWQARRMYPKAAAFSMFLSCR